MRLPRCSLYSEEDNHDGKVENNRKQHVVGILFVTILLTITCFISQHHVQGKTEKVAVVSGDFYLNKKMRKNI